MIKTTYNQKLIYEEYENLKENSDTIKKKKNSCILINPRNTCVFKQNIHVVTDQCQKNISRSHELWTKADYFHRL